ENLSFIFQFFNLFDVLTAVENVALPLLLMGEPTKVAEEKSKVILREVGMGSRLYNRPNEMSGGQRQRVAIARSLITKPKIILADEPTGDLSSVISRGIMKLFRRLNEDLGQTFVLVTHSELIGSLCDRIIKMNDGLIIS
ncbi:MAG: ATP-binding cassette domain-containing protein, partial [Candidatus Heimdallarchaeota archaeon]|nr:ATP-binding cassette domain-containing protein [Candidatus Heimdallarchaeota archaeon]